ncbi:MAG: hypothetical protein AAFN93_03455 [Bacteroidota bacterium]
MKNILAIAFLFCISFANVMAQDKFGIELKDGVEPDVYIDGKKYDYSIFQLLDQTKIESVTVIKDKPAKEKYNAPNGVVIVKTKNSKEPEIEIDETKIKIRNSENLSPVIVIDGKVADKAALSELNPKGIDSIVVLKGEKAIEQYNAPNGVVVVKTKKN